jgi:hypothetical protein
MNNLSENMVFSLITFILISWTISLIYVIHNYNKEMNYLHETIEYQGEMLNTIKIDMKPISQFKGLTQYRTFSCTVGDGQIYYD